MKMKRFAAMAILGVMTWAPAAMADEVVVSAAASLTNAFKAVGAEFEKNHPGTTVLFSFGSSDTVLQQIINGAPSDLFASADQKAMDKAVQAKAVEPATRVDFARNEVVLIVPADGKLGIGSLADLEKSEVTRITLGNPASVPVGRYTEAALKQAGKWEAVQAKAILAQNVRQALDYVARAEVDAGFVFATDAAIMPEKVKVVARLASPVPVLYPLALTVKGHQSAQAQAFSRFVLSAEGQAILAKYGFGQP